MPRRDSQVGHQRDTFTGVKGGRSACVRLEITSLGVKMYRKETAVHTQRVFMGIGLVRKTRKETERGNRYGRGQRIRARSFNQPANHRTASDRPVRNGRSTLLLTVRTNDEEEERRSKKKIAEQERRNRGSNRERERERMLNTIVTGFHQWPGDSVSSR